MSVLISIRTFSHKRIFISSSLTSPVSEIIKLFNNVYVLENMKTVNIIEEHKDHNKKIIDNAISIKEYFKDRIVNNIIYAHVDVDMIISPELYIIDPLQKVRFFVKIFGCTKYIEINKSRIINDVKILLFEKTKIPEHMIRLTYIGKTLLDEKTIESYNIENDSTLMLDINFMSSFHCYEHLNVYGEYVPINNVFITMDNEIQIRQLDEIKLKKHHKTTIINI